MNRLVFDAAVIEEKTAPLRALFPNCETPVPGSLLQIGDDVKWDGPSYTLRGRVLWGAESAEHFHIYCPEYGEDAVAVDWQSVTDRAPVDPQAQPMPLWPDLTDAQARSGDAGNP